MRDLDWKVIVMAAGFSRSSEDRWVSNDRITVGESLSELHDFTLVGAIDCFFITPVYDARTVALKGKSHLRKIQLCERLTPVLECFQVG